MAELINKLKRQGGKEYAQETSKRDMSKGGRTGIGGDSSKLFNELKGGPGYHQHSARRDMSKK